MAEGNRPLGVTIIGILYIIGGLFLLFGGIFGGIVLAAVGLGAFGIVLGGILAIVGIIDIIIGIGCFKGWGWIWTIAVIFAILGIIIQILTLVTTGMSGLFSAIIGILISVIILWYLFQDNVKRFFGKA